MNQKTFTRYLPAGMNTATHIKDLIHNNSDILSDKPEGSRMKSKKKTKLKKENVEQHKSDVSSLKRQVVSDEESEQSQTAIDNTIKSNLSPPTVICRNKSIVLDDVSFEGTEYSGFDVDITNLKLPSVTVKHKSVDKEISVPSQKESVRDYLTEASSSRIDDGVNFRGMENSVFDVDIGNTKPPSATVEQHSVAEISSVVTNKKEQVEGNLERSSSKPIESEAGINFKSKLLQKIKKPQKSQACSSESHFKTENIKEVSHEPSNQNERSTKTGQYFEERHKEAITNEESVNLVDSETCSNNFNKDYSELQIKKNIPFLKTSNIEKPDKIIKIYNNHFIIHGTIIPKPVNSLEETCFHENVIEALQTMKFTSPKKLQSYTWPAIQRGLNVFMVGPHQSGKKSSYLPAITTFALQMPEKYMDSTKYQGPFIIILCSNENKCKHIYTVINNLIRESWASLKIDILTNTPFVDDCDILVAVMSDLEECLKSKKFTFNRLCHLVFEDANILLKSNPHFAASFLTMIDEMQKTRSLNKNIQIIVSSEKWTADLETLMKKLYIPPVIYFQDFFEAALYSNIRFTKKKLSEAHKRFHLEDILKQKYSLHKSIVFCNEDEIAEVKEYLEMKGIECIVISNDLIEDEIFENEDMWCSLTIGRYKVLLCTDELFKKTIHSVDANWLIHYSLPSDWKTFQNRFRCLAANIQSLLMNKEEDDSSDFYNCSFVFTISDKKCTDNICNDLFNELITSRIHSLKL